MARMDEAERVHLESRAEWRAWLSENHATSDGVWIVVWRDDRPRPSYDDLVEEALCFGWIDAVNKSLGDDRRMQWYSPRRPRSPWAATNKVRVARLIEQGLMTPAGQAVIDQAKASVWWSVLDGPEAGIVPPELQAALDANDAARETWESYPASVRKYQLTQIAMAMSPATVSKRIASVVHTAAEGKRP